MASGYKARGGGVNPLNFKVVGGTSAPANPAENTIWINTSTPITSWVFSATEPDIPVDGMVWIAIGTSSAVGFNALKKSTIMVYPISAKQYVSGAWVNKTAKSYQGGAWVDWWNGELYKNGNEYTTVTGGWKADQGSSWSNMGIFELSDDGVIYVYGKQSAVWAHTVNTIDLTDFNYLRANVTTVENGNRLSIAVLASNTTWAWDAYAAIKTITGTGLFELDVSSLSGKYYVAVGAHDDNNKATSMRVSEVYLEK